MKLSYSNLKRKKNVNSFLEKYGHASINIFDLSKIIKKILKNILTIEVYRKNVTKKKIQFSKQKQKQITRLFKETWN